MSSLKSRSSALSIMAAAAAMLTPAMAAEKGGRRGLRARQGGGRGEYPARPVRSRELDDVEAFARWMREQNAEANKTRPAYRRRTVNLKKLRRRAREQAAT